MEPTIPLVLNAALFAAKKIAVFSARNAARNNATNIAMRLSDIIPRPRDDMFVRSFFAGIQKYKAYTLSDNYSTAFILMD